MNRGSEWNWDIVESVVEWVWMEGINVRICMYNNDYGCMGMRNKSTDSDC